MSTDEGASWSKGKALPGVGCVKPRLLMLGEKTANGALKKGAPAGPLILVIFLTEIPDDFRRFVDEVWRF